MVAKVALCQFKNKLSKFILLVEMLQEELSLDPKSFRKSYKKVVVVLYYLEDQEPYKMTKILKSTMCV